MRAFNASLIAACLIAASCDSRHDGSCDEDPSCIGCDMRVEFAEGPGTKGLVCQYWAQHKTIRFRNSGSGWCLVYEGR